MTPETFHAITYGLFGFTLGILSAAFLQALNRAALAIENGRHIVYVAADDSVTTAFEPAKPSRTRKATKATKEKRP